MCSPKCRQVFVRSRGAHPPHLRLAPGPVLPRGRPHRHPGALRRPPAGDRPRRAGRCRAGLRRRLRPGAAPGAGRRAGRRDVRAALGGWRPHRGDERQPRLRDPARQQRAPGRQRRGALPHPVAGRRHPRHARRRRRAGARLRHPLPRARRGARAVGAARPHPRGGPGRGDGAHRRRPRRPAGQERGDGPRLRRRFRGGRRHPAQRQRARHLGRWPRDRADPSLHPARLRRAGPPARCRAAHRVGPLQRGTGRLLLLRGAPHQGQLARGARPRRPARGRLRACSRRAGAAAHHAGGWRSCCATRPSPTPSAATSPPHSPTRCAPAPRWSGCDRGSRTCSRWVSPPSGASARTRPAVPRLSGRSDHDIALGFVQEVRQIEATTEEALLLQMACDSCTRSEDRDADSVAQAV